jgi:cation diffusion facilitator family transporter
MSRRPAPHDHSLADHRHGHAFLPAGHERNERRTILVVILTAVMMVAEIIAGYVTGSMALLADGFHMATHAGALAIAAAAYRYARHHVSNPRFTFGTGKVGDLAGFASALILAGFAAGIAWESVLRLFEPQRVAFGEATLVAVLGLVVNLVSAWLLGGGHAHDHGHSGHDHAHTHAHAHSHGHDNNMRSAYLHVLADALTSVLAIVALLAGRYLGWVWLDPVIGIVGALVILRWSWGLLRDTAAVLLDMVDPRRLADVRRAIEIDDDARVADLHVWQVGPGAHAAIVSIVATKPLPVAVYRNRLAAVPGMQHVTIEVAACAVPHDEPA